MHAGCRIWGPCSESLHRKSDKRMAACYDLSNSSRCFADLLLSTRVSRVVCQQQLDADGSKSVSKQEWMAYFEGSHGPGDIPSAVEEIEYVSFTGLRPRLKLVPG